MAYKVANRVKMTVAAAPGQNSIQLNNAVTGFRTFDQESIATNDTVPYILEDGQAWELGIGTYTASGTWLARTTVTSSSAGGTTKINASAAAVVMIAPLAADFQNLLGLSVPTGKTFTASNTLTLAGTDGSTLNVGAGGTLTALATTTPGTGVVTALGNATNGASGLAVLNGSGYLSVAQGGTGIGSLTAGYIPYGNGTGAFASNPSLFWDAANTRLTVAQAGYSLRLANSANSYGYNIGRNETDGLLYLYGNQSAACGYVFTGAAGELMRIASDGSVGIGTTTPTSISGFTGLSINNATYGGFIDVQHAGSTYGRFYTNGDGNAYLYNQSSNSLIFGTGGSSKLWLDASGNLGLGVTPSAWSSSIKSLDINSIGSFAASSGSSVVATNTYFNGTNWIYKTSAGAAYYEQAQNVHKWFVAGSGSAAGTISFTQAMTLDASGNLLVGTQANYGKISAYITTDLGTIASAGSANNIGFSIQNTASGAVSIWNMFSTATGSGFGAGLFAIARGVNTPAFYITSADLIYAPATYNSTTATAANMVINSGGLIQRSTSSRRYKTNIVSAVHGLTDVLNLRSVTYKGKNDGDKVFGGLIAEEVDAAGLTEFVAYDDEGKPDALHYGNMAGLFVKAIQELAAKVSALEAKVA